MARANIVEIEMVCHHMCVDKWTGHGRQSPVIELCGQSMTPAG